MNTQKKQRKSQPHANKDRGDTIRKNGRQFQAFVVPRDRGDVSKKTPKKVSKQEICKTTKLKSVKTDLVTCSTNTNVDSLPSSFDHRYTDVGSRYTDVGSRHTDMESRYTDVGLEECRDYRKIIKERYTFKRFKVKNDDNMNQFNYTMRCDVKNALPMLPNSENANRQTSKDSQDANKSDKTSVHRAVSAIKMKRTPKSDADRKKNIETTRKERKPVIKTVASKTDARVYKAVTFEVQHVRKPLHIKIPTKDVKPKPRTVCDQYPAPELSKNRATKRVGKRIPQRSPSFKSADSMPTEIAKWVPESVNQHTQPYYEAWVSKTATASTKLVKQASLEKSKVLHSLKLGGKESPELMYQKYAEEEYAGRIRVRRRGVK